MSAPQPSLSYDDLVARVAELTALLEKALARVAELEARLKVSSSNSSKPPSSDGLAKPAPKSLRARSGQGPGRPKGQDGVTLERFADAEVVRHVPAVCAGCGDSLTDADEVDMTWRQVVDVPPVKPQVTEHQMITLACRCGHHTTADAPAEAVGRRGAQKIKAVTCGNKIHGLLPSHCRATNSRMVGRSARVVLF